jgi:hypothetical protein
MVQFWRRWQSWIQRLAAYGGVQILVQLVNAVSGFVLVRTHSCSVRLFITHHGAARPRSVRHLATQTRLDERLGAAKWRSFTPLSF